MNRREQAHLRVAKSTKERRSKGRRRKRVLPPKKPIPAPAPQPMPRPKAGPIFPSSLEVTYGSLQRSPF
jgi:hypothetical protein